MEIRPRAYGLEIHLPNKCHEHSITNGGGRQVRSVAGRLEVYNYHVRLCFPPALPKKHTCMHMCAHTQTYAHTYTHTCTAEHP